MQGSVPRTVGSGHGGGHEGRVGWVLHPCHCDWPHCMLMSRRSLFSSLVRTRMQHRLRRCANMHEDEGSLRVTVTLFQKEVCTFGATGLLPSRHKLKVASSRTPGITWFANVKDKDSAFHGDWECGSHESRVRYTLAMGDSSGAQAVIDRFPASSRWRKTWERWCGRHEEGCCSSSLRTSSFSFVRHLLCVVHCAQGSRRTSEACAQSDVTPFSG